MSIESSGNLNIKNSTLKQEQMHSKDGKLERIYELIFRE